MSIFKPGVPFSFTAVSNLEKSLALFRLQFVVFIIFQVFTGILCAGLGHASHDETLVEKANGRDVVESVIRRITNSNVFQPDLSFLIRLAFTETKFGTDENIFRSGYYGGIWQVDESVFNSTQSNSSRFQPIYSAVQEKFHIKWTDITWEQLLKPLYSGLAAAIYFSSLSTPIPDKIDQQANYWKQFYKNDGDIDRLIGDSEELRNLTKCRGKMDLIIVLDSSGSIGIDQYNIALRFVASFINSFTLDHTRIGMLIYSNNVEVIFPLRNKLSIAEMAGLAKRARYFSSGTNTHLGILEAVKMFQRSGTNGGVPKIMIVLTDGDSNDKAFTIKAVGVSEAAAMTSMSVGIGKNISDGELKTIALNDPQRMYRLSHFLALQDFLFTITEVACKEPQVVEIRKTYSDSLVKDEKRLYALKLPEEGLSVLVIENRGEVVAYWSKYEKVLSKAVHDGKISGLKLIPGYPEKRRSNGSIILDQSTAYISIKGLQKMNNYEIWSGIEDSYPLRSDLIRVTVVKDNIFSAFFKSLACFFGFGESN